MRYLLIAAALVSGCKGPMGAPGMPGTPGPPGQGFTDDLGGGVADGGLPPRQIACTPGMNFCASPTHIATCTLSGRDAVIQIDCATLSATSTNAYTCAADSGCVPGWTGGCCKRDKVPCAVSLTAPAWTAQGSAYWPQRASDLNCSTPTKCPTDPFYAGVSQSQTTVDANMCSSSTSQDLNVSLPRTVLVGQTVSLPATGVFLSYRGGTSATNCGSWTGTVRLDSDVPAWSVTFNATCSDPAAMGLRLVGTMSGNQ